jgi:hypothetical protein
VQFGSANAEKALSDRATTRRAVNASIMMMRLITLCILSLLHSPNVCETQVTLDRM